MSKKNFRVWSRFIFVVVVCADLGQVQAAPTPEPNELHARLQTCQTHFDADRLLTGKPGTAYECYKSILKKYPEQPNALAGLQAIAQRYEAWTRQSLHDQRIDKAERYIRRLSVVAPDYPQLAELKEKTAQLTLLIQQNSASDKGQTSITSTTVPRQLSDWQEELTGIRFVKIPAGCFTFGSQETEEGRYKNEQLRSEVCLKAFWLSDSEVTNAQYRQFVATHNSRNYLQRSLNDDAQPVVFVSWLDAMAFADWLSKKYEGKYRFRLPTEAEWEYAARAGSSAARFWGDDPHLACQFANVLDKTTLSTNPFSSWVGEKDWHRCEDGFSVTAPVKQFQANAFGLYDTLGNVWEWTCSICLGLKEDLKFACLNSQANRENALQCAPLMPEDSLANDSRIIKGGAWNFRVHFVRSAVFYAINVRSKNHYTGFRLLKEVIAQE